MKILHIDQGTPEWFEARALRLTASHARAISVNGKGLETYVSQKVAEHFSSAEKSHYTNFDMNRGKELEDEAGTVYAWERNVDIQKIGFVIHNDYVGCSPDLFANKDGLAEIKCHKDEVHFELVTTGKINGDYLWQIEAQMLICHKKWCDYVAYNPNFKKNLFVKRIEPDQKQVEKLQEGFVSGEKMIKSLIKKYGG